MNNKAKNPPWAQSRFSETDNDPFSGLVNIMDVMLVFALGLLIALISQNREMQQHFRVQDGMDIQQGRELSETPQALRNVVDGNGEGMKSLGQVYQDPETGKLILIAQ